MSMYPTELTGNVVVTKQTEVLILRRHSGQAYGASRLGLLHRDIVLKKGFVNGGDGDPPYGGHEGDPANREAQKAASVIMEPRAGMLRIVEVLHDSPLTPPKEEEDDTHVGEYVVLRNASGARLWLGGLLLHNGSTQWQFPEADTLEPDGLVVVAYGTPGDEAAMLAADNLPASVTGDPALIWRW